MRSLAPFAFRMWTCSCSKSTSPRSRPDRLGATQAGRVDELEQRAVPEREGLEAVGAVEDRLDLVALRRVRQPPPAPRRQRDVGHRAATEREAEQASHRRQPPRDRRRRKLPAGARAAEIGCVVGEDAHVDPLQLAVPVPPGEVAQVGRVAAARRIRHAGRSEKALDGRLQPHAQGFALPLPSPALDERFDALAELAIHGVNLQPGQLLGVTAFVGQEELARAVARSAYRRGARYVDVFYFDPWVKRARIEKRRRGHPRLRAALVQHAAADARRAECRAHQLQGVVVPGLSKVSTASRLGRDQLPWLKESMKVMNDRSTNWCVVPCPTRGMGRSRLRRRLRRGLRAALVRPSAHPAPRRARSGGRLGGALRRASLRRDGHHRRRFDSIELVGPGTELTVGLLPTSRWRRRSGERHGIRHLHEPSDRGGLHDSRSGARRRACHRDAAARHARRHRDLGPSRPVRRRPRGRDRRRPERRGASRQAGRRRGRDAARRARARGQEEPRRPDGARLLRHPARRERGHPHRARRRLPLSGRRVRLRPRQPRAGCTRTS